MRRLFALLFLLGCSLPVEPIRLPREAIEPPPHWRTWWQEVWDSCGSQLRRRPGTRYEGLEFYMVPAQSLSPALGMWMSPNRILLAHDVWEEPLVVRHEMLHAQIGAGGHPPIFAYCDSLAVRDEIADADPWIPKEH